MKKFSWLVPASILIFVLFTVIFLSPLAVGKNDKWPIKQKLNLGLDLKGGTQIVLTFPDSVSQQDQLDAVDPSIEILRNRIDQYGVAEPTITKIQSGDETDILVQLPGVSGSMATNLVGQQAVLQFKMVAPRVEAEAFVDQVNAGIQANLDKFPTLKNLIKPGAAKTDSIGVFRTMITAKPLTEDEIAYEFVRANELDIFQDVLRDSVFARIKPPEYDFAMKFVDAEGRAQGEKPSMYVLRHTAEMEGGVLESAKMQIGSSDSDMMEIRGKPYISLVFTRDGAAQFANTTTNNIGRSLAIAIDNVVYSAPRINDAITEGQAMITGMFSRDEARFLSILLNNKSLSKPLETKSTSQISASLGADSIRSGVTAGLIGIIAVILFMLIYYKVSGLVADFVLVFNVGFILAALTAFGGTLTMPGIAGIILTIGMAVDANVLIFERIREELDGGKTPRSAVDAGYKRAVVTIWDANLTTLIAAFVLYQFGTGPVKGFALTLTIGIIGSMFSAIVFVRYIMEKTMLAGVKKTMSI